MCIYVQSSSCNYSAIIWLRKINDEIITGEEYPQIQDYKSYLDYDFVDSEFGAFEGGYLEGHSL
jgi:hypothetical protein